MSDRVTLLRRRAELRLKQLRTQDGGAIQQITHCLKALCQAPDWSPDGLRIAYERIELNKDLPQLDQGVSIIWRES